MHRGGPQDISPASPAFLASLASPASPASSASRVWRPWRPGPPAVQSPEKGYFRGALRGTGDALGRVFPPLFAMAWEKKVGLLEAWRAVRGSRPLTPTLGPQIARLPQGPSGCHTKNTTVIVIHCGGSKTHYDGGKTLRQGL